MNKTNPLVNKAPATKTSNAPTYENNPFFVATNGLDLLFKKAQSIGILLAVIAGLYVLMSLPSLFTPPQPASEGTAKAEQASVDNFVHTIQHIPLEIWLLAGFFIIVVLLIFTVINIIIKGIIDYTSAQLAAGKEATTSEAFRVVLKNFWGYTWVQVVVGIKTLLWTLLFIIPGFIMSYRYSLAGVAYFDKALKGNGSVKHSLALTKGAWLTTYASQTLLNLLTLGAIPALLMPGTNAVLYRQLTVAGTEKPKAHLVSWLTLLVPVVMGLLILAAIFFLSWALINYSHAA